MRILILHSRYTSGSLSGENRVVDEEAALLRDAGHDVDVLAPSPDEIPRAALAARTVASTGVAAEIRERVRRERVEIVHCHNLFPALGPAVVPAAAEAGAAVVVTLHNYRLMCLAGTFFRDGRICEDCLGRSPWPGVLHACYRGSRPESAVLAGSVVVARIRRTYDHVHRFLAVSEFVRAKHVEAGFSPRRVLVKPNVVPAQPKRDGPGEYFLVLGRLSVEKGVSQVVRAWNERLGTLRVVGDGPMRAEIERLAVGRGVRVEGPVPPGDVAGIVSRARALVLPSACFEGQPRAILEAYAAGVPVIASRIGGIPDLVTDGETGLTVPPDDSSGWREAAEQLAEDGASVRLGEGAYARWGERFSPARGREMLERAYGEALEERAQAR
jgi:glycosyltransferase involved in cell wall biosynthesis